MMLKSQTIGLAFLVALSQPVFSDDLLSVYQQALQSAPDLKASALKVEVGSAQKGQALAQMLPQVTGSANWSENDSQQGNLNQNYGGTRYFVSLTQSVINFAKFWEWQRTREQERQFDAEYIDAQQTLMFEVVKRYFSVLDAEDQLRFIETERQTTETYLQQINTQFAKELVTITDVYELEAQLDQIKADQIEAESILLTAKLALKELTNMSSVDLSRLREDIAYKELEGKLEDWIEVAKSENPTLAAQRSAIEAASADVVVRKSKYLPEIDLQLYYYDTDTGYQSVRTAHTQTQVAALNVNVPIFTGGATCHFSKSMSADCQSRCQQS
jgi:outer membrane protein